MSISPRVASKASLTDIRTHLRRLKFLTDDEASRKQAGLVVQADLLACLIWLAKSEGVRHTCDLLDACADHLIADAADIDRIYDAV